MTARLPHLAAPVVAVVSLTIVELNRSAVAERRDHVSRYRTEASDLLSRPPSLKATRPAAVDSPGSATVLVGAIRKV